MTIYDMKVLYNEAKKAAVGSAIQCPGCGKAHEKTTYHKVFCSNAKTRAYGNCKDAFWNKVDPEKACRNTPYFHEVIRRKSNELGYEYVDKGPEGWDGHKD